MRIPTHVGKHATARPPLAGRTPAALHPTGGASGDFPGLPHDDAPADAADTPVPSSAEALVG
eukprot:3630244-Prymnesium_polylepis.1